MNSKEEFESLYNTYLSAQRKGDMGTLSSLYAKDAIFVPADSLAVEGRSAICAMFTNPYPEDLEITLNRVEVENNSAWVYAISHWNVDGQRRVGVFMDVWRRNNGKWQISACIVNSANGFVLD